MTSSWAFNPTFTVWASARSSGSIILKLSMTIETLSQSRTWNCNFSPGFWQSVNSHNLWPRIQSEIHITRNLTKIPRPVSISHDDVIKWKHFPRYWPFVRGIHRSIHYDVTVMQMRCLIGCPRKVSKLRYLCFELSDRSKHWQVSRQYCRISMRYGNHHMKSLGFETWQDLTIKVRWVGTKTVPHISMA